MARLYKAIIYGVVEALEFNLKSVFPSLLLTLSTPAIQPGQHTGPVSTFADFVVHVPTSSALSAAAVEMKYVTASIDRNEGRAMAMAIALELNTKAGWAVVY
jgi:hypothetical protein